MKYQRVRNFYYGEFVDSESKQTDEVVSPLDGSQLSSVPMSTKDELNAAVDSAKQAAPTWAANPIKERVQVFFRYRNQLEQNSDELTALISEENGKTWDEAKANTAAGTGGP